MHDVISEGGDRDNIMVIVREPFNKIQQNLFDGNFFLLIYENPAFGEMRL